MLLFVTKSFVVSFSMHQSSLAVALVRKLIAVLESTERLPVISYDHGGGGSGLQVRILIVQNFPIIHGMANRGGKYRKLGTWFP